MQIIFSEQFLTDLSGLKSSLYRKCRGQLSEISKMDAKALRTQTTSGWRLHKLKSSPFVSLSVDMNFRMLCKIEGEKVYVFRVVKHDLADSAHINRNDGIDTPYVLNDVQIQPREVFNSLIALGFPKDYVRPFEEVTNDDEFLYALDQVDQRLQTYAFSVYETAGVVIPRTKYTVFDTNKDFEAALQMSMDEWELYLHPSQQYIVELPVNHKIAINGAAGTGKTVCAWHRMQRLAQRGYNVGFVCSNKKILEVSKQILNRGLQSVSTDCYFLVPNSSDHITQLANEVDHVVIDEGQELSVDWLSGLGGTGFTLFYDLNQLGGNIPAGDTKRFNHRLDTWRSTLNSIPQLSNHVFYINYRNSREIAEYCYDILAQSLPNHLQSYIPLFEAGKVVVETINDRKQLSVQIARAVQTLRKDYKDNEIGLIFNSYRKTDRERLLTELRKFNIKTTSDIQNTKMILRVSPRDIKGHERKVIILCTPPMDHATRKLGKAIDVYVAITRARDRLIVFESS